jgi:hypothetical protein
MLQAQQQQAQPRAQLPVVLSGPMSRPPTPAIRS